MKRLYLSVLFLLLLGACSSQSSKYDFQNPDKPIEDRIENLLSLLTLEEKVGQMMHESPAIDRLGIPSYNWWNECLHGVTRSGQATVFPQAIGMAATFEDELKFNGYIVSDCGAISNFYNKHAHHVVNTPAEAAGMAAVHAMNQSKNDVHKIDIHLLRKRLKEEGQYFL